MSLYIYINKLLPDSNHLKPSPQLSRGKNRAETFIFSKNAVICEQPSVNKQLPKRVLMFRIGDMRKSQVSGWSVVVNGQWL